MRTFLYRVKFANISSKWFAIGSYKPKYIAVKFSFFEFHLIDSTRNDHRHTKWNRSHPRNHLPRMNVLWAFFYEISFDEQEQRHSAL